MDFLTTPSCDHHVLLTNILGTLYSRPFFTSVISLSSMVGVVTLTKPQRKILREDYHALYLAAEDQKNKDEVLNRAAASIMPKGAGKVEVFGYQLVSQVPQH